MMVAPNGFKPADFGLEPTDTSMYRQVTIDWQKPQLWQKGEKAPIDGIEDPAGVLYALIRDHGNAKRKCNIQYIGKTEALKARFNNHLTAQKIIETSGDAFLSIGIIKFSTRRQSENISLDIEEIEHILIWAVNPPLNERKSNTLPCWGVNGGNPFLIFNEGYRFSGRMPKEIVYPWMLIKPGRDRSRKPTA